MRLDLNEGSVMASHGALGLLSTTHGCVWIGVVSIYRFPWIDRWGNGKMRNGGIVRESTQMTIETNTLSPR